MLEAGPAMSSLQQRWQRPGELVRGSQIRNPKSQISPK